MATPLVTQIKNRYFSVDCGMGYIIRLCDGRFVIIDGGYDEAGEAEHLYDLLCTQNETADKPTVAAWFFTHLHCDHIGSFAALCRDFPNKVNIERIIYNFPSKERCPSISSSDFDTFENAVKSLENVEVITAKTGQSYTFADSVFNVIFTQEDMPSPIERVNDSSLVVRTEIAGHRIMWLGDVERPAADRICEMYSGDDLKCDIMQVGHHGYGGGSDMLYRSIDPETLLWPIPDFTYHYVSVWDCNDYLMSSKNIRRCFLSGREEVTLDLTKPLPPSPEVTDTASGTIVYEEDFTDTDLFRLGFCCITGGSVVFKAADLELKKGCCTLKTDENYAVCEFLQPRFLYNANGYTLEFDCKLQGDNAEFSLFWNNDTPMKRELERAWKLNIPKDKRITVRLIADAEIGTATLCFDGESVDSMPYTPTVQHGLYFVLKNAELELYKIKVTAN